MNIPRSAELALRELEERGIPYHVEIGSKHDFLIGPGFRLTLSKGKGFSPRTPQNMRAQLRRQLAGVGR